MALFCGVNIEVYCVGAYVVDAGVSDIKLMVPKISGSKIILDADLSNKDFDGFYKTSTGNYSTENYQNSKNKITDFTLPTINPPFTNFLNDLFSELQNSQYLSKGVTCK